MVTYRNGLKSKKVNSHLFLPGDHTDEIGRRTAPIAQPHALFVLLDVKIFKISEQSVRSQSVDVGRIRLLFSLQNMLENEDAPRTKRCMEPADESRIRHRSPG
jgi:hypothetical protein